MLANSTSTLNSQSDLDVEIQQKRVREFAKHMLQGRYFVGRFQEKRYIKNINAYRDVVIISKEEKELIYDLEIVRERLRKVFTNSWIGITLPKTIGAPVGHCVWVELSEEVFGSYWYKVRSVKYRDNEVLLSVKAIRTVNTCDDVTVTSADDISSNDAAVISAVKQNVGSDRPVIENIQNYFIEQCSYFFNNIATLPNLKSAITFVFIFIATIATVAAHILRHCPDYFLKLLRELTNLMKVISPIVIACVNGVVKIFGGLMILISMMFRSNSVPPAGNFYKPTNRLMLTNAPYNNYNRRHQQSVVITEIN